MKFILKVSFFLFIFFLLSCKKDKKDTQPPSVTWISPGSGQHFNMYDTIAVSATVVDNNHLAYINVTLTDLNHTPLQPSYAVPITSAGFTFNIRYVLSQYHLSSGTYLMQITADDGSNTVSSYQSIYITESPTLFWGFCTVLKNANQTINFIDTSSANLSGTAFTPLTLLQAYNGMKYGGYYQQLYVNGKGGMPFQAFYVQPQTINQSLAYSANATTNQVDYTTLYTDGTKPYVGFLNSDVNTFDNSGAYSTSYRLNDINYYPYLFTKTGNYGVGVYKSKIAPNPDKIVAFTSFGAFFQSILVPSTNFKVVALFEKGNDSLYVLGNDANNNAQAYVYYPPNNAFSNALLNNNTTIGSMLSAVKINGNYFIFSSGSTIYSFQFQTASYISNIPVGAQKLAYQPKLNWLVAATGSTLNIYTVGTNSLTLIPKASSINCIDSIIDFEVITNK